MDSGGVNTFHIPKIFEELRDIVDFKALQSKCLTKTTFAYRGFYRFVSEHAVNVTMTGYLSTKL